MNIFAVIVLAALLVDFVVGLIADLLNLKALRYEPPPPLKGLYDPDKYRKSQQYTRAHTYLGIVSGAFFLVVILAFWLSGGFGYLDRLVRSWGFPEIANGLVYIAILVLAYGLLSLPFGIYGTFVVEERFGFNRTTPRVFIMDLLKGLGLGTVLGIPLLAAVLALFQYAGPLAWVYCWLAVTAYSLVMDFVAPTWIMPLFNKFTPMPAGELRDAILSYAQKVDYPVSNLFVMDGSKRSTKGNAFFTGFGRNKRIALFDTLISRHTVKEIVAVLAHEIGHHKKKHVLQGMIIGIVHSALLFFLISVFLNSPGLYQAFYVQQPSVYTGLLFFGMLYAPIEMVLSIGMQAMSRRNEYEADRFAAHTVEQPESLAGALKRLYADSLSNLTPHPFYVFLNYSHPPLWQRVEAIKSVAARKASSPPLPLP